MQRYQYTILLSFIMVLFVLPSHAQFNFGVGYSLGRLDAALDKRITNTYNQNNEWFDDDLEPINSIQGFNVALRYRWDFVAFEVTWRNKFRSKRAEGIDPATNASFRRRLNHRYISYSVGIENFIGDFSYGGSIDIEQFAVRTEVTGIDGDFTITSKYGLGNHFFIAYNLDAGDALDFSIRPYVHFPWQRYDIGAVAEELNGDISGSKIDEFYMNFGIMFVFYNGNK